jgi:hypothetical protein
MKAIAEGHLDSSENEEKKKPHCWSLKDNRKIVIEKRVRERE